MTRHPLFPIRAPKETHQQLRAAAKEDGLTIAAELARLLDLRREFTLASRPRHPLARPAAPAKIAEWDARTENVEPQRPQPDSVRTPDRNGTNQIPPNAKTHKHHTDSASRRSTPEGETA